MITWDRQRIGDVSELVYAAMPEERLAADELLAVCFDDPGLVLATPDGHGVVSAVTRSWADHTVGWVRLLAVAPERQRTGIGRALLAGAEEWAFDQGASEVQLANSAPFYLWPGIDTQMLGMLCLAEAAGYEATGSELNMSLPTTFRAEVPHGVVVRRAIAEDQVSEVCAFVVSEWSWWEAELRRAVEHGSAFGAWTDDGEVIGFACHSVNRLGWIGPMGTDRSGRHVGVGRALLSALCTDLMVAQVPVGEIAWVGPMRFYAKAGAQVSRSFRTYRKPRR